MSPNTSSGTRCLEVLTGTAFCFLISLRSMITHLPTIITMILMEDIHLPLNLRNELMQDVVNHAPAMAKATFHWVWFLSNVSIFKLLLNINYLKQGPHQIGPPPLRLLQKGRLLNVINDFMQDVINHTLTMTKNAFHWVWFLSCASIFKLLVNIKHLKHKPTQSSPPPFRLHQKGKLFLNIRHLTMLPYCNTNSSNAHKVGLKFSYTYISSSTDTIKNILRAEHAQNSFKSDSKLTICWLTWGRAHDGPKSLPLT